MSITEAHNTTEHAAGFALLGSLGKRVLRPGGAEMTRHLLADLAITTQDDVVELAPGRGHTARLILERQPASYYAVDRDIEAEQSLAPLLVWPKGQFRRASVSRTGLPDLCATVGMAEAVLTMHPLNIKENIVAELARLVRPGGRIGLHEVAYRLDDLDHTVECDDVEELRIETELTADFKVPFQALTMTDWESLLARHGFSLESVHRAPLRLLEPDRIVADEGFVGAAKFAANVFADPSVRRRITHMRATMRRNAPHLRAVAMIAHRHR